MDQFRELAHKGGNVEHRPQVGDKHPARKSDGLGLPGSVLHLKMSRRFFQPVDESPKLFLQIGIVLITSGVGGATIDQTIDGALDCPGKWQGNSVIGRSYGLQGQGANMIAVPPKVDETGQGAIRGSEHVDLVVPHGLPDVV